MKIQITKTKKKHSEEQIRLHVHLDKRLIEIIKYNDLNLSKLLNDLLSLILIKENIFLKQKLAKEIKCSCLDHDPNYQYETTDLIFAYPHPDKKDGLLICPKCWESETDLEGNPAQRRSIFMVELGYSLMSMTEYIPQRVCQIIKQNAVNIVLSKKKIPTNPNETPAISSKFVNAAKAPDGTQ